jgi:TolA-binding protein
MRSKFLPVFLWIVINLVGTSFVKAQSVSKEQASYSSAKELFDKGLFSAARIAFESHLENFPEKNTAGESSYYRAVSAVRLSQKDAESLIQSYVQDYPNDSHASSAYIELAEYYYDQKSYKKSISFFEQSENPNFDNELINFKIGYAYFIENEHDKAVQLFSEIKKDTNLQNDASYFLGYILKEKSDFDNALVKLKQAFSSEEYSLEALKLYSIIQYEKGNYASVIEEKEPETSDPILLKLLGDTNYELGKYRLASISYKSYLKKSTKNDAASYYKMGMCFFKLEDNTNAVDNFKKAALAKDTVGAYASYYLGTLYTNEGNLIFASTSFKNSSKYETEIQSESMYAYAKSEFDLLNHAAAIVAFNEYRSKYPSGNYANEINEMLTQSYLNNKDYESALSYIESLSYLSPKIKQAYQRITYQKGTEYFNGKKFESAVTLFKRSLKYPENNLLEKDANYWIAEAYSFENNYNSAIPFYTKAILKGSDLAKYGLAYAHYNQKDYAKAGAGFQYFINAYAPEINKSYLNDALMRAGDCFFVSKEYDRAIIYYEKSKQGGGKNLEYIYYQSGVVYRYNGDQNKAIASFEQLVKEFPKADKTDDAIFQIAQITYETGDYNRAVDKFQSYIRKYPDSNFIPFALLNQGVSYNNLKKYDQAVENYQIILDRFPRHETANSALLGLQGLASSGQFNDFSVYLDKYKKANPESDALENIEFETAKSLYYNQKYDESISTFQSFLANYPKTTLYSDAQYFLSDAFYRKSDLQNALLGFYNISSDRDFSKYAKVIYRIASIESELGNNTKALAYFSQLKKTANSSKEMVNALTGLMENMFILNRFDSASFYGQDLIANHRISNEIEASAMLHVGEAEYKLGHLDESFDWLLLLVNKAPDERGAEAKFFLSKILFDKKDYSQSMKSLFELTETYSAYDKWMGKAFILMSDNYLATDELFQAEATLNSLIENSSSDELKEEARKKLKTLEKAKKEELVIEKDTVEVKNANDGN